MELCKALKENMKDEVTAQYTYNQLRDLMPTDNDKKLIEKIAQEEGYHQVTLEKLHKKWCE